MLESVYLQVDSLNKWLAWKYQRFDSQKWNVNNLSAKSNAQIKKKKKNLLLYTQIQSNGEIGVLNVHCLDHACIIYLAC